jgi:glycosyltransferase involved in cell wall biosynthesis
MTNDQSLAQDYFLLVSRLVPYKHVELAIQASNEKGFTLKVVGQGPEYAKLAELAGPLVELLGFVDEKRLASLYANARAVIYTPKDEDFGIIPIEALSYGKAVIAHNSGGVQETLQDGVTGFLFNDYSVSGLIEAIERFNEASFDSHVAVARANEFSEENFRKKITQIVTDVTEAK